MDYTRQRDFFDPDKTKASVTIVGCGGIGSFAALALAKLGVQTIRLVDFDTVEDHNIPNQLYRYGELHLQPKVDALADIIQEFAQPFVTTSEQQLQHGIELSDIVISALDSMEARADPWQQVKYKLQCKLFLDARLAAENIVLYSVKPTSPTDIAGYEATLHSDEEGLDLPCTGRAIIDVGFAVASLITRAVRRQYAHEDPTPQVYLNQRTLEIYKGGWE